MKTNAKLLLFAVLCSAQFISCKKENITTSQPVDASSIDEVVSATNLVAWYKFTNGNTADFSNKNNHLTAHQVKLTTDFKGRPNNAYLFNGKSSYMSARNSGSLNPSPAITLAALVKPTGLYTGPGANSRIFMKGSDDQSNGLYFLGFHNSGSFFGTYGNNQYQSNGVASADNYLKLNTWYKLVYTYNGSIGKLYINDTLVNQVDKVAGFTPNTSPLLIGKTGRVDFPYWFKGAIDEIRIYNVALSKTQVTKLTNELGAQ